MQFSQEEQKTQNLLGHLVALRNEIAEANSELTNVYTTIDSANAQLTGVLEVLTQTEKEVKSKKNFIENLNTREEIVVQKELEISRQKEEIKNLRFAKEQELKEEEDCLRKTIANLNRTLLSLRIEKDNELEFTNANLEKKYSELARLGQEISEANKKLEYKTTSISYAYMCHSDLVQEIRELHENYNAVQKEIDETLESKETIFKNLEERESAIIAKERDLRILTERIRKAHKRYFPSIDLRI